MRFGTFVNFLPVSARFCFDNKYSVWGRTWPQEHNPLSAFAVSGGRHDAQVIAGSLVELQVVKQPVGQGQLKCHTTKFCQLLFD